MEKKNYQKELDAILESIKKEKEMPSLLLHSCCAPCSSYVLEYLASHFNIVLFYYNPNIFPREEYEKRRDEQLHLVKQMALPRPVSFVEGKYEPQRFFKDVSGLEQEPEGGRRCALCFAIRLKVAAEEAKRIGARYFTTTLSVSPHKDAVLLHKIGEETARRVGVAYLPGDYKKKGGYQRSIVLSNQYGLYRQNYCGCIFSQKEAEQRIFERIDKLEKDRKI
jgi:predicted adenine nucleotide alpha hydrolase (AANH) superfamily ATPase